MTRESFPYPTGGGDSGDLMRATDWSQTALGPPSTWPKSLISTVGLILHSRHPMFLWWGPELVQLYNDAYVPSFGRGKHPAAMGQRGADCWQEIWPIIWPQIDDVMARRTSSWNEDALVPIERNGRIEEVYWTYGYSPVFDDAGAVGGTLVVCSETTSRVIASRRLAILRQLSDALSSCERLADVTATVHRVLATARLDIPFVVSYRRDPKRGWSLTGSEHLSEADRERIAPIVAAALERRESAMLAVEIAPDDAAWPEPVNTALLFAPSQSTSDAFVFGVSPRLELDEAYRAFLAEVTETVDIAVARFEAFRARAELESERRNLLMQAPVATALLTGPKHVFQLVNPLYLEIIGGRDIVGKPYVVAFPEIAGTALEGVLDTVYATGQPFVTHEYHVPLDRRGRGTLEDCYYKFNLEPLRDAQGAVYGMMAVAVDITEHVAARRALEKTTQEREKLLAQLEAANHTKDEFLATVSHELRTPLNSILGWARLLDEEGLPARLRKGVSVIERNARAQSQIIEDILDVSRIVSGKIRMTMRRIDPGAVITAAIETVRPQANAKKVTLTASIAADIPALVADADRLQQVVWNLLSNAVKFTSASGAVDIAATAEGSSIVISVADTGRGIAAEFLPHVFERFRQDDSSASKQYPGLGLGLAIVRHLIELHGGTVTAKSAGLGHGSTFEVRIPILSVQQRIVSSGSAPAASPPDCAARAARLAELRVLVVDDHQDGRELLALALEDAGARVTQADSAPAAREALGESAFDVLVSDIGMPGEDGYALIAKIRASAASALPALALTAYARSEDREKALAAGFQKHVAKPIDPLQLVELVAELAGR